MQATHAQHNTLRGVNRHTMWIDFTSCSGRARAELRKAWLHTWLSAMHRRPLMSLTVVHLLSLIGARRYWASLDYTVDVEDRDRFRTHCRGGSLQQEDVQMTTLHHPRRKMRHANWIVRNRGVIPMLLDRQTGSSKEPSLFFTTGACGTLHPSIPPTGRPRNTVSLAGPAPCQLSGGQTGGKQGKRGWGHR